jgi:hypothetical protein
MGPRAVRIGGNFNTQNNKQNFDVLCVIQSKLVGYVECMGGMRNIYKILDGISYGKRPFGRP